jgi:hypothetical protein
MEQASPILFVSLPLTVNLMGTGHLPFYSDQADRTLSAGFSSLTRIRANAPIFNRPFIGTLLAK